jgi:hypothetical protein
MMTAYTIPRANQSFHCAAEHFSSDQIAELRELPGQFKELRELLRRCALAAESQVNAAPPLDPIPESPLTPNSSLYGSELVEVDSASNIAEPDVNSTLISIAEDWYPHVHPEIIKSIVDKTFERDDLAKLGSSYIDQRLFTAESTSDITSFLDAWLTYVGIRSLVESDENKLIGPTLNAYTSLLISFSAKYEWHAILAYHQEFFGARLSEKKFTFYVDEALVAEYLVPYPIVVPAASPSISELSSPGLSLLDILNILPEGYLLLRFKLYTMLPRYLLHKPF